MKKEVKHRLTISLNGQSQKARVFLEDKLPGGLGMSEFVNRALQKEAKALGWRGKED